MNFRKLKILSKWQRRAYNNYVAVPEIKLEGKWLRHSGFKAGEFVKVEVQQKKIIITLQEKDQMTHV